MFIDLDNFKGLNDTLESRGGRILLQQVAARLLLLYVKTTRSRVWEATSSW
ncbi:MAG: diguanylate cyclase [Rhodocyclaceae bacterium]|nr:diguanylate cyclase [Rhodocyclaceae bacterium]